MGGRPGNGAEWTVQAVHPCVQPGPFTRGEQTRHTKSYCDAILYFTANVERQFGKDPKGVVPSGCLWEEETGNDSGFFTYYGYKDVMLQI